MRSEESVDLPHGPWHDSGADLCLFDQGRAMEQHDQWVLSPDAMDAAVAELTISYENGHTETLRVLRRPLLEVDEECLG